MNQIGGSDLVVAIEVRGVSGILAPGAEQGDEIASANDAVVVEIGRAVGAFAFIGDAVAVDVGAAVLGDVDEIQSIVAVAIVEAGEDVGAAQGNPWFPTAPGKG